ncbi:hypothetical protein VOLCADRAFT_86790 [Volvox carteri f. nagariensis]|uniref:Uncharacterized protein n=1 Tax=Volvox carteri f. nagariensis TaxID=3068 RepID=D8TJL6_VOLCA|nr:uncharacterized protein VOLCADRAFT_86790 [Volvox carteri f. nagariensis]EFJ52393.1 hypothetical protein VOLCADRAFT_86790 [Volvox carteri f. nagariensis]|eukprot:XP_002946466.1 hypothetical protein VOLCADRAFT_86790 [Volvox carteri f. nagariensis]
MVKKDSSLEVFTWSGDAFDLEQERPNGQARLPHHVIAPAVSEAQPVGKFRKRYYVLEPLGVWVKRGRYSCSTFVSPAFEDDVAPSPPAGTTTTTTSQFASGSTIIIANAAAALSQEVSNYEAGGCYALSPRRSTSALSPVFPTSVGACEAASPAPHGLTTALPAAACQHAVICQPAPGCESVSVCPPAAAIFAPPATADCPAPAAAMDLGCRAATTSSRASGMNVGCSDVQLREAVVFRQNSLPVAALYGTPAVAGRVQLGRSLSLASGRCGETNISSSTGYCTKAMAPLPLPASVGAAAGFGAAFAAFDGCCPHPLPPPTTTNPGMLIGERSALPRPPLSPVFPAETNHKATTTSNACAAAVKGPPSSCSCSHSGCYTTPNCHGGCDASGQVWQHSTISAPTSAWPGLAVAPDPTVTCTPGASAGVGPAVSGGNRSSGCVGPKARGFDTRPGHLEPWMMSSMPPTTMGKPMQSHMNTPAVGAVPGFVQQVPPPGSTMPPQATGHVQVPAPSSAPNEMPSSAPWPWPMQRLVQRPMPAPASGQGQALHPVPVNLPGWKQHQEPVPRTTGTAETIAFHDFQLHGGAVPPEQDWEAGCPTEGFGDGCNPPDAEDEGLLPSLSLLTGGLRALPLPIRHSIQ